MSRRKKSGSHGRRAKALPSTAPRSSAGLGGSTGAASAGTQSAQGSHGGSRPLWLRRWFWPGLVLAGLMVGVLLWLRPHRPLPPRIDTSQLEVASAELVEQHLRAVRAAPRSGVAWGQLGAVLRSFDFRKEATVCLAEAERLDPKEPRWPYLQVTLLSRENPVRAEERLRRAVDLCGSSSAAPRLHLARLLAETGRWGEAEDQLRELLRAEPANPSALLTLAYAAQARGDFTNAIVLARGCTASAYTARAAWTLLGALHQRLGEANAAFAAARRATAVPFDVPAPDPFEDEFGDLRHDARSLSDRAQQYLMARQLEQAAPLIQRMVQEHAGSPETWLLLGRQKLLQKDPAAAERALLRHLEMDPRSVHGHFQLGMALLAQSRWIEAATAFEKAVALKPDFGPAFFNQGFALVKAGKNLEATAPFREAIRHSPEYIDSYILLADLSLQLGRKADAVELERQARQINPEDTRLPVLHDKILRQPGPGS